MPVQSNVTIQNVGTIAWDGTSAFAADIRKFTRFGWSFEVTGVIAVDAVFSIEAADPDPSDNCSPDSFADVPEIALCSGGAAPGNTSEVTIPAGTPVGTICAVTIPCRPGAFVRLAAESGTTANVSAVLVRQGPK